MPKSKYLETLERAERALTKEMQKYATKARAGDAVAYDQAEALKSQRKKLRQQMQDYRDLQAREEEQGDEGCDPTVSRVQLQVLTSTRDQLKRVAQSHERSMVRELEVMLEGAHSRMLKTKKGS